MKYVVMLGDGMADYPDERLGGKTVLEAADIPNMDFLAQNGAVGLAKTVPDGMKPGSDVANLSAMGYDPKTCYTGRSPLEAVSMGIKLDDTDVTFRCNLVTLSDTENYEDAQMVDYSAGEISSAEAEQLISALNAELETDDIKLYAGVSYRHCLVLKNAKTGGSHTPPHDISLRPIKGRLPQGENSELLISMMKRSREILRDHPVNKKRIAEGKNPANSCWFWGEGTKPSVPSFKEKYGLSGAVISAVDLVKGIGLCAGNKCITVAGATGNYDTNFSGKARAALEFLKSGGDYAYIHVEAPDECGHHNDPRHKIESVEAIDRDILGYLLPRLKEMDESFSILLMPDHPTPLKLMTHVSDPVPFALYRSDKRLAPNAPVYSEKAAKETGLYVPQACELTSRMIDK